MVLKCSMSLFLLAVLVADSIAFFIEFIRISENEDDRLFYDSISNINFNNWK